MRFSFRRSPDKEQAEPTLQRKMMYLARLGEIAGRVPSPPPPEAPPETENAAVAEGIQTVHVEDAAETAVHPLSSVNGKAGVTSPADFASLSATVEAERVEESAASVVSTAPGMAIEAPPAEPGDVQEQIHGQGLSQTEQSAAWGANGVAFGPASAGAEMESQSLPVEAPAEIADPAASLETAPASDNIVVVPEACSSETGQPEAESDRGSVPVEAGGASGEMVVPAVEEVSSEAAPMDAGVEAAAPVEIAPSAPQPPTEAPPTKADGDSGLERKRAYLAMLEEIARRVYAPPIEKQEPVLETPAETKSEISSADACSAEENSQPAPAPVESKPRAKESYLARLAEIAKRAAIPIVKEPAAPTPAETQIEQKDSYLSRLAEIARRAPSPTVEELMFTGPAESKAAQQETCWERFDEIAQRTTAPLIEEFPEKTPAEPAQERTTMYLEPKEEMSSRHAAPSNSVENLTRGASTNLESMTLESVHTNTPEEFHQVAEKIVQTMTQAMSVALKEMHRLVAGDHKNLENVVSGVARLSDEIRVIISGMASLGRQVEARVQTDEDLKVRMAAINDRLRREEEVQQGAMLEQRRITTNQEEANRRLAMYAETFQTLENVLSQMQQKMRSVMSEHELIANRAIEAAAEAAQLRDRLGKVEVRMQQQEDIARGINSLRFSSDERLQSLEKRLNNQSDAMRALYSTSIDGRDRMEKLLGSI